MAYKDESEYKTPKAKREYDEQWRRDNPGYHAEATKQWNAEHPDYKRKYNKSYREANKEDVLYMAMIDDEYYFGHTSQGMDARRDNHLYNCKNNRGNPRMKELYKQLGEDEFMRKITFKVIKTFDTLDKAKAAEKLMLSQHVGQPKCMNKRK